MEPVAADASSQVKCPGHRDGLDVWRSVGAGGQMGSRRRRKAPADPAAVVDDIPSKFWEMDARERVSLSKRMSIAIGFRANIKQSPIRILIIVL